MIIENDNIENNSIKNIYSFFSHITLL